MCKKGTAGKKGNGTAGNKGTAGKKEKGHGWQEGLKSGCPEISGN